MRGIVTRRRCRGHSRRMRAVEPTVAAVRVLADARRLEEGAGARFSVTVDGIRRDAFVVRWRGALHAYLNTCRHELMNLDFGDARFFDDDYDALVCCHHGARYRPDSGACIDGP